MIKEEPDLELLRWRAKYEKATEEEMPLRSSDLKQSFGVGFSKWDGGTLAQGSLRRLGIFTRQCKPFVMGNRDLWNIPARPQPRVGFLDELEKITRRAMQRLSKMDRANLTDVEVGANATVVQRLITFNIELRSVRIKLQNGKFDRAEAIKLTLAAFEQWRIEAEGEE